MGRAQCDACTRCEIMLVIALILFTISGSRAGQFNITRLMVPSVVPPQQDEVEIECQYDANFTLLNWFKGPNEFFRYKPGSAPSTRSFPILGVGRIELLSCGPTACHLKLGSLTEEATGLYRCDIERDVPPYKFETRTAYMQVHGHEHRRPVIEGLADEYGNGEEMEAVCRGAQDSELRWYINGREMQDLRGLAVMKTKSSRWLFLGVPPMVTVQCAEFRYGKLSGSKEMKARWRDHNNMDETAQEQRHATNSANIEQSFTLLAFICNLCLILTT